jgi:hypothetical protein
MCPCNYRQSRTEQMDGDGGIDRSSANLPTVEDNVLVGTVCTRDSRLVVTLEQLSQKDFI